MKIGQGLDREDGSRTTSTGLFTYVSPHVSYIPSLYIRFRI